MKLKKLEITGFKSFMGKTRIVFPPGTTGVVGPNGCGKSNVVDALRWVMGEQNVRKLRGKTSEDIIFAGSAGNPPMNMAEVSLTIDNEDASVAGPFNEYSEITVTRRIFRSGETQTFINRQPARLKDIQALFLGSGTGKNAFAVIQQGNIGALTDATPEERRVFIEEAADVTKYKARKRETESRIKSTRENLERVGDIIAELERQLESLKHQAKKALAFKELQQEIRELDLTLSGAEQLSLAEKAEHLTASAGRLKAQSTADGTRREALTSAMERLKLHAQAATDAIEANNQKIFELKRQADRDEARIAHLKEKAQGLTTEVAEDIRHLAEATAKNRERTDEIRALTDTHGDLTRRVTRLDREMDSAEKQRTAARSLLVRLEQEGQKEAAGRMELMGREASLRHQVSNTDKLHESASRKLKRRDEEVATARTTLASAQERHRLCSRDLATASDEARRCTDHVTSIRDSIPPLESRGAAMDDTLKQKQIEESRIRSFLETMQRMVHNHEGYGDGVKEAINHLDALEAPHQGVMADRLQVRKGFETAAETALGTLLTHILVGSSDAALQGARAMQEDGTSRCGFFPPGFTALSPFTGTPPDGCRPLTELITMEGELDAPFPALLSRFFVAEDLATALTARMQTPQMVAIATPDGGLVDFSGSIVAGTPGESASLLKRRTELLEAGEALRTLQAEIAQASLRLREHQKTLEAKKEALRQAESEWGRVRGDRSEKERACLLASEEVKQATKHLALMELETEQLAGDLADLEEEMEEGQEKLLALQEALAQKAKKDEAAKAELSDARNALTQSEHVIMEFKLAHAREEARHENHRNTVSRLTGFLKEGEALVQRLQAGIEKKNGESNAAAKLADEKEKGLAVAFTAVSQAEEALAVTRTRLARIEADMAEKETERKELAATQEEHSERLRRDEVDLAGILARSQELRTRILEQYQAPIEELTAPFDEEIHAILHGNTDKERLKLELGRLKRKINRMGEVNMAAVAQYEEMKERHGFLFAQQRDLTSSLNDLEAIIRKINRITQERFVDTFHRINEKLEEIFPRLFEGGSARLVLTDPGKPLETGVELMIQPPGKKQARLSLLSGGEKALSAIAFVFSIFLLKPSSFCVMDEIDAPLDDANVLRFNNLVTMIAENSQIFVITHNKITMEHADILIGVTMEKKGISKVVSVNLSGKEIPLEAPEAESA